MRYALPVEIPTHEELIDNHCFGICKQISIVCTDVDGAGICWVCEYDECKYEDASIKIADDLTLRKLDVDKEGK